MDSLNVDWIVEPFWRNAVTSHTEEYVRHFGERLVSVYVWGSVHLDEAVAGVSDLDLHVFITESILPSDEEWFQRERHKIEAAFPETKGLSRPLHLDRLLRGGQVGSTAAEQRFSQALAFRLSHNATRAWGTDLMPDLERLPSVDEGFAIGSFESQRDLSRWVAAWVTENKSDFALPDNPSLRLRKLARLAVVAGAWFLIARGRLFSLRGVDALPLLREEFPAWDAFLEDTKRLYIQPSENEEAVRHLPFYTLLSARWNDMLGERLGMGATIEPAAARSSQ